ncbi:SAM-dependent methyltransferase [Streptomyces sp. 3211.6]|uniref:class I SAM-dependent methyltransferase n=1 Tax=Streptomyces sp. 3211.6 TaxID=1938845 RepID=UPI000F9D5F6E|nr:MULTISPECIES: SAM-dependent methyltransferase [unclassified Streptomyces]RPF29724.1 methyltransferase (TIGR00027 family) [Streptomyces sp. Ag109_G2-6]
MPAASPPPPGPAGASPPAPEGVPATAYLTALARARASAEPDGALRDPYAERFARLCPDRVVRVTRNTAGPSVVVARTLVIDRLLSGPLRDGAWEVCVNLGAGFDARTHRLDWPASCRVIEVDRAAVLDLKDRLLPAATARVPVERLRCDLRDPAALSALLRPRTAGRRTLLLAEGLLTYLTAGQVRALAAAAAEVAGAGGAWICDVLSPASARTLTAAARSAGTPLTLHGLPDLDAFETTGWHCTHLEPLPTARPPARGSGTTGRLPDGVLWLSRSAPAPGCRPTRTPASRRCSP